VAIAFQPAKSSACCHRTTSRPRKKPPVGDLRRPPRRSPTGTRDSSGWGAGAGRVAPFQTVAAPAGAHRFQSGAWGRPQGGAFTARRAQPIRRVGELAASPSAPRSGGAEGAACGQGGNAPGCEVPPGVRERARPHAERPSVGRPALANAFSAAAAKSRDVHGTRVEDVHAIHCYDERYGTVRRFLRFTHALAVLEASRTWKTQAARSPCRRQSCRAGSLRGSEVQVGPVSPQVVVKSRVRVNCVTNERCFKSGPLLEALVA
jgi:hypothetical protein